MTPTNYKELVQIYTDYKADGLEIIAYPCNQFNNSNYKKRKRMSALFAEQEPGRAADILAYGVTFPIAERIEVNGENAHPVWAWMR